MPSAGLFIGHPHSFHCLFGPFLYLLAVPIYRLIDGIHLTTEIKVKIGGCEALVPQEVLHGHSRLVQGDPTLLYVIHQQFSDVHTKAGPQIVDAIVEVTVVVLTDVGNHVLLDELADGLASFLMAAGEIGVEAGSFGLGRVVGTALLVAMTFPG